MHGSNASVYASFVGSLWILKVVVVAIKSRVWRTRMLVDIGAGHVNNPFGLWLVGRVGYWFLPAGGRENLVTSRITSSTRIQWAERIQKWGGRLLRERRNVRRKRKSVIKQTNKQTKQTDHDKSISPMHDDYNSGYS